MVSDLSSAQDLRLSAMLTFVQGCCQSTDRDPYEQEDSSAAQPPNANNDRQQNISSRAGRDNANRSLSNADTTHEVPKARPNQPVRPPTPLAQSPSHVSKDPPPWTRSILDREREAFFDTRVSGHEEVWKALRMVCEMLRRGDVEEAQGILDAMNMTCPNGKVARSRGRNGKKGGAYDERGQLYDIPPWVLTDPQDVVEDEDKDEVQDGEKTPVEKGKGRAEDPGEIVKVRARLSDRGTDVVVSAGTKQKISVLIKAIREESGCKRLRLMYLGKTLDERSTLEESGWRPDHVINAMVFAGDENMLSKKPSKPSSK